MGVLEARSVGDLWALVEGEFETACKAYNVGRLVPLVEADVVGYVYYPLLTSRLGPMVAWGPAQECPSFD